MHEPYNSKATHVELVADFQTNRRDMKHSDPGFDWNESADT